MQASQKSLSISVFAAILGATMALPVAAQEILILAEDIPAGLDYDGPSAAIPASQQGMVTLMEPLLMY